MVCLLETTPPRSGTKKRGGSIHLGHGQPPSYQLPHRGGPWVVLKINNLRRLFSPSWILLYGRLHNHASISLYQHPFKIDVQIISERVKYIFLSGKIHRRKSQCPKNQMVHTRILMGPGGNMAPLKQAHNNQPTKT